MKYMEKEIRIKLNNLEELSSIEIYQEPTRIKGRRYFHQHTRKLTRYHFDIWLFPYEVEISMPEGIYMIYPDHPEVSVGNKLSGYEFSEKYFVTKDNWIYERRCVVLYGKNHIYLDTVYFETREELDTYISKLSNILKKLGLYDKLFDWKTLENIIRK